MKMLWNFCERLNSKKEVHRYYKMFTLYTGFEPLWDIDSLKTQCMIP